MADFIYKKMNETVAINGTESVIETLEKVRPMSGNGSSSTSKPLRLISDWLKPFCLRLVEIHYESVIQSVRGQKARKIKNHCEAMKSN